MENINILMICTGKYSIFFEKFYNSCEQFFLKNYKKTYYVFTDNEILENENVIKIHQSKLGWPNDTMMRFKMFNKIWDKVNPNEYVFFFNANMLFLKEVNEEVIPKEEDDYLMGVTHPGYYSTTNNLFPYERNEKSKLFIPFNKGKKYYQGCFNGGRVKEFSDMSSILEQKIDEDVKNNHIPLWHDESALNWFYTDKNPLSLLPSYAYPESFNIPFDKMIIQLDKNKLGGHNYLRN